jgi:tripartite-type tricarboxylate transporter receptor subunit TctC
LTGNYVKEEFGMKKMVSILLASAMIFSLTACGGGSASSSGAAPQAEEQKTETAAAETGDAPQSAGSIGFVADETLTMVVPGKAGGGSDLAIRYYAQALTDVYGLKTTVTNYDSNTIGHQMVKDAKPDGTTLTLATGALNIQYITGNSDIDPMNDFTLIACMQDNGYSALAVPKDAPYDDFAGFVEYAKAHPGEINVGMPAAGSNTFLFGKLRNTVFIGTTE